MSVRGLLYKLCLWEFCSSSLDCISKYGPLNLNMKPWFLHLSIMCSVKGEGGCGAVPRALVALQIEQSDTNTREIAAIISLAPASPPSRRKLVIQRKGNDKPIYLDILSPFVEPLHYLLLLPEGTLGWSPSRLTRENKKFSQARWYRTRFFMNAEQMSTFSRLTGKFFPVTLLILSISRRMVG